MTQDETRNTSLLIPSTVKRALDMVAADQETTASDLLRKAARKIVKTYKGGVFFDIAVRDSGHLDHEDAQGG